MLQTLKIKNFALIADQTIEFGFGFNVLVGETGAGKSTISDEVAKRLNILHLDTGAMYRAVGLAALEKIAAGDSGSGAALVPNYLRLSQAERERLEK